MNLRYTSFDYICAPKMNHLIMTFLSLMFGLLQYTTKADISVSLNPQSQQLALNKDVVMNCEFRFTPRKGQSTPLAQDTQATIEWLKKDVNNPIFSKVVEHRGSGFFDRSLDVRVYAYNEAKQTKASSLEIRRISESDAGAYKCIISGGITSGGAETTVAQLQIVPDITVSPSVVSIELDRPFRMSCNVTTTQRGGKSNTFGGRDVYTGNPIRWTFSNARYINPDDTITMQRLMENSKDVSAYSKLDFSVGAQQLSVMRATKAHAGYYWCTYEAQSGTFQGRVQEKAIVRYGPTFKLNEFNQTNTTRAIKAFVGDTVDIYCNIISLPFAQVEWFRNNRRIVHDQTRYDNMLDGRRYYYHLLRDSDGFPTVLRLNNLQYRDRDEYVCNVTAFGIRRSWSTLLKVKDRYSAFYPLGVIVTQMVLIFSLIFGAEKVYVKRGDHHHDHHQHHQNHTSQLNLELDNSNATLRNRTLPGAYSTNIGVMPTLSSQHLSPQLQPQIPLSTSPSTCHQLPVLASDSQLPPLILQPPSGVVYDSSLTRSCTLPTNARSPGAMRSGMI